MTSQMCSLKFLTAQCQALGKNTLKKQPCIDTRPRETNNLIVFYVSDPCETHRAGQ
jgi:hypothetical protein